MHAHVYDTFYIYIYIYSWLYLGLYTITLASRLVCKYIVEMLGLMAEQTNQLSGICQATERVKLSSVRQKLQIIKHYAIKKHLDDGPASRFIRSFIKPIRSVSVTFIQIKITKTLVSHSR